MVGTLSLCPPYDLVAVKTGGGHLVRRPVLFELVRSGPGQTNLAAAARRHGVAAS